MPSAYGKLIPVATGCGLRRRETAPIFDCDAVAGASGSYLGVQPAFRSSDHIGSPERYDKGHAMRFTKIGMTIVTVALALPMTAQATVRFQPQPFRGGPQLDGVLIGDVDQDR